MASESELFCHAFLELRLLYLKKKSCITFLKGPRYQEKSILTFCSDAYLMTYETTESNIF